jgi:hypothetical protein
LKFKTQEFVVLFCLEAVGDWTEANSLPLSCISQESIENFGSNFGSMRTFPTHQELEKSVFFKNKILTFISQRIKTSQLNWILVVNKPERWEKWMISLLLRLRKKHMRERQLNANKHLRAIEDNTIV